MAARIYADVPGSKCQCGGVFSKRVPHPDDEKLRVPKCNQCNLYPPLFFIDAEAFNIAGEKIRVRIRNDQNNTRLDRISKVVFTLERVQQEILEGTFDVRKYDSSLTREAFLFKNYVVEYMEKYTGNELKKKKPIKFITPKSLHDKKGLIRRELIPFFGEMELGKINAQTRSRFIDSYTYKFRTLHLALGELKVILNEACRDGMINHVSKFEPIPRANTRDEIIPKELALQTIAAMTKEIYRDMYTLMLIYPMRPGELRALTWKNVDFVNNEITICQHFSKNVPIEGRKSIKKGKKESAITWPLTPAARDILSKYRNAQVVSLSSYAFLSLYGKCISEGALWEAWKVARDKVGHSYAPYECRHVSASDLYERTGGDLIKMKRAGGWTNTTTLERYVHDRSDINKLF